MNQFLVGTAYAAMFVAQRYGPEVIEFLHGTEARIETTSQKYDDVNTDSDLEMLCQGYEAHHYNPISNCSHAAGMILSFIVLACAVIYRRLGVAATLPPIWYLYAWAGHFFIQKDIPAVFVYGMTFRGWLSGEYCSVCALLSGRTISRPLEFSLTTLIVLTHILLFPPVASWDFLSSGNAGKTKIA